MKNLPNLPDLPVTQKISTAEKPSEPSGPSESTDQEKKVFDQSKTFRTFRTFRQQTKIIRKLHQKPEGPEGSEGPPSACREYGKNISIRVGEDLPDLPDLPVEASDYLTVELLAALIEERRKQFGLSQEGLASYVEGLDRTTVANWESRRYLAAHLVLLRALDVLGIELKRRPIRSSMPPPSRQSP